MAQQREPRGSGTTRPKSGVASNARFTMCRDRTERDKTIGHRAEGELRSYPFNPGGAQARTQFVVGQ
jgi:hypothetical protein